MIKEKFPRTTVKAMPNIESRVKPFRSKTAAIADIIRSSGFAWNHESSTIECEKSAYDEYVKNHKEATGLYGKSFPFFNDLAQVFTKDRAHDNAKDDIGDDANQHENISFKDRALGKGDIGDDADRYLHENNSLDKDPSFSQMPSDDFFMPTQEPINSPLPMASNNSVSKTFGRRKRKALACDSAMEAISENFRHFIEMVGLGFKMMAETAARNAETAARNAETAARNAEIAAHDAEAAAGKEAARKDIEEKKKLLSQVIFKIDGLSDDEVMGILQVLGKDEDQLKIFWDLPDDKKLCFCRVFLARMSHCLPSM
ncbi:hypothetical protein DsansV1_C12g0114771 [Dioscorea sansibarensis]